MNYGNTGLTAGNFGVLAVLAGQVVDVQPGRVLVIGVRVLVVNGFVRLDGAIRVG